MIRQNYMIYQNYLKNPNYTDTFDVAITKLPILEYYDMFTNGKVNL